MHDDSDGRSSTDGLIALLGVMRDALCRVRDAMRGGAVFRLGRLKVSALWRTAAAFHAALHEMHPIPVAAGFEDNPNVEGGAWRSADGGDDALVHLRFLAGTEDLPLHVHEYSDRLLVVTSGVGLFHYLPDAGKSRELRSLVVEAGDAVLFTRGLIHTFTAPLGDLTLLSYHAPFFEFNDSRQYTIPASVRQGRYVWTPGRLAAVSNQSAATTVALSA